MRSAQSRAADMNRSIETRLSRLEGSRRRGGELTEAEVRRMTDAESDAELLLAVADAGGPEAAFAEIAVVVGEQEAKELMQGSWAPWQPHR
jgi:hypothetical protein